MFPRNYWANLVFLGLALSLAVPCFAAVEISFDQPTYEVNPGPSPFVISIHIDGDNNTSELDPVANGLFSVGALVSFEATKASVASVDDIIAVSEFDFTDFSIGSVKQVDAISAGAKGNVDQTSATLELYTGTHLATVNMTNQLTTPGTYQLTLGRFQTKGASEQIIIDGIGNVLDVSVIYGTATVRVVPEPASSALAWAMYWLFFFISRRQRSH